jgi:hypothetical protein
LNDFSLIFKDYDISLFDQVSRMSELISIPSIEIHLFQFTDENAKNIWLQSIGTGYAK